MLEALTSFFSQAPQDGLYEMRKKAWEKFLTLGLPEKRDAFQYVSLHRLSVEMTCSDSVKEGFVEQIPEASRHSYFVFVNGSLRLDLSDVTALPESVVVSDLHSAMRTYGTLLHNRFQKSLQEESNPFVYLNLALHTSGLFLYVPPGVEIEVPVHCLFVTSGVSAPRLQLFVGKGSILSLVTTTLSLGEGLCNVVTDIQLDDGARCTTQTEALALQGSHFHALRATLKRNATLKTLSLIDQGDLFRFDALVSLLGEGAEAEMRGLWQLDEKSEAHVHIVMDHGAPHTRSLQKFKGLLEGFSRSSFEGKILVRQIAQKTEAYQLNQNLVLGEHAQAYSKPNLEIFADDVKASHGTTVSQLDPAALFYLKTRGLEEKIARSLLVDAFCHEMRQS